MGTDNLNKRRSEKREERKSKELQIRSETWLIVCEGIKTETQYFLECFRYINAKVDKKIKFCVKGTGKNTKGVVSSVDDFFAFSDQLVSKTMIPYGKVFTVFDKDSFTDNNFNSAIKMSEQRGYIPLWSNECFELWFLLHYEYFHSNVSRQEYYDKLSRLMPQKYEKNANHFVLVGKLSRTPLAMKNAKKLYDHYPSYFAPARKAPCTMVFRLFEEVENYLDDKIENIIKK